MNRLLGSLFFWFMIITNVVFAMKPPPPGAIASSVESAIMTHSGKMDEQDLSSALRIGVSGVGYLPMNTSIELGYLDNSKMKYTRFNLMAGGWQPQVMSYTRTDLGSVQGYGRLEIFSVVWAEGGYVAYNPSIEAGASIRFSENWALQLGGRASNDARSGKTVTSLLLGLIHIQEQPAPKEAR